MKKDINENKTKNSKKPFIRILIIFAIVFVIGTLSFLAYRYYKINFAYKFELVSNKISIKVNDEIDYDKLIKVKKNVDISYVKIPTNVVGKYEIKYIAIDKFDRRHYHYLKVNVLDDIAPIIDGKTKVTLNNGVKVDLKSYVKVSDNYDKEVALDIDGSVDTKKEGTYNVTYTAIDSSGNKTEHVIEFTVKKKEVVTTPPVNNQTSGTTSKGYKIENKNGVTYIKGILIANKTYSLPSTYGNGLTSSTKSAFNELKEAAAEAGFTLRIGSGYRSYNTQKNTYNRYVKRDGKSTADTYSARPGHSEHQTGLAIDICANGYKCIGSGFNGTKPANWLSDNAYKYGFILRYPNGKSGETGYKFESWHYRYVGKELAETLYNNGNWITLENYLGITSKYNY